MTKRKTSQIDRDLTAWVNSLTDEQMFKIYEAIDGPIPSEIARLSDDELLEALQS